MIPDTTSLSQLTRQEIADLAEHTLVTSKSWLAEATFSTDPAPYTQFWRWTAKLYRAARRSNVPQQAWQDAQELIRRAERALAQSIRAGQHSGRIRLPGERASEGCGRVARRASLHQHKISPRVYATSAVLNSGPNGIYCFANNVSDERFDAAIAAARVSGGHAGLIGRAQQTRRQTRSPKVHCIAAAAVEAINSELNRGHKLTSWWRVSQ